MTGSRDLPLVHFAVRVPWRDHVWDGSSAPPQRRTCISPSLGASPGCDPSRQELGIQRCVGLRGVFMAVPHRR
jgi:hypothetical protein